MDKDLVLEQTDTTPYLEAWVDLQLICMGGNAIEEDSLPIFNVFNEWLETNLEDFVGGITFEFNFKQLSSSYSRSVLDLFKRLNSCSNDVVDVSVRWHCEVESDVYYEGVDFKEMANFDFEILDFIPRPIKKRK